MKAAHASRPIVAVVMPCYRASETAAQVLAQIGREIDHVFVVDDACPENTGDRIEHGLADTRVQVLRHPTNQGVGGATVTGYRAALAVGAEVVVKIDADGQMDPGLIGRLIAPILSGQADYVKGNRFHHVRDVMEMPKLRLAGNAALSFLSKLSTGYWQLFDPTNGFTAVHRAALAQIDLDRVSRGYFFESDLLYHLNQARAVVVEMPMRAVYGAAPSSLRPGRVWWPFLFSHTRNIARRIIYSYFVRGFSAASVALLLSLPLVGFGTGFGLWQWGRSAASGEPASAGTVMLAALPILVGTQLLLSWLNHDVAAEPVVPLQRFDTPGSEATQDRSS